MKRHPSITLLIAAVLLMRPLVLLAGDKEAEALYARLDGKIKSAKTLQIACHGRLKTAGFESEFKASLLMKEGNKMRMELKATGVKDGQPHSNQVTIISDGTRIRIHENDGAWQEYVATKTWNNSIAVNISRGGFPSGLELVRVKKAGESQDAGMAFRPLSQPTDLVLLTKDQIGGRDVLPIEFRVKSESEFVRENNVILWLDPSTSLPVKRLNVIQSDRSMSVTEDYDRFVLDGDVDETAFGLPKE